jgi:hypothetical protein
VILFNVVFTVLPSKCSQSKGAGLLGLNSIGEAGGRDPVDGRGFDGEASEVEDASWGFDGPDGRPVEG